jgi:cap2 methyltransferase
MNIDQLMYVYKRAYGQAFVDAAGAAPACHSGTNGSQMAKDEPWREALNNKHVLQAVSPNNPTCGYSVASDIEFERLLLRGAPVREYRKRGEEMTSTCHWGQRKLLLSEIEFMTMFPDHQTVVYAGAAPGTHIPYLSSLFPETKFVLIDPAPFTCHATENILTKQEMFTDDIAMSFANQDVLFISDIRAVDFRTATVIETEEQIAIDMNAQMRWHEIMNPIASILKFRLPWDKGTTEYLAGDIKLPVWGPQRTTEARLIVKRGAGMRTYDDLKYEQQMSSFNTHTRVAIYPHTKRISDVGDPLYCHCYDCVAEIRILEAYLKMRAMHVDASTIRDMASQIDNALTPRRRMDENFDREEHHTRICKQQYVRDTHGKSRPGYEVAAGKNATHSEWLQDTKKKRKKKLSRH